MTASKPEPPPPRAAPPRLRRPAWAQAHRFLSDPFSLLRDAQAQLGDLFSLQLLGLGRWVFLCSPELVREMFRAPVEDLVSGEINGRQLGFMLGLDATFSFDGQAHLERRRLVFPYFNGRAMLRHVPLMREVTERALATWPRDDAFPLLSRMHRISLEVLMRAMFHRSEPSRMVELMDLFDQFASRSLRSPLMAIPPLQIDLGGWSPWGRILRMRERVRREIGAEIGARMAAAGGGSGPADADIVESLIRVEKKDGEPLSHGSILDEVINLLFAGHETTGTILTWCIESVCSHPEVRERMLAELDRVVGDGPVEGEHLDQLPYLDAVIQETIRYRPIAPMAGIRLTKRPFAIGGFVIPEGTIVTQCFPVMARRPDLFARPEAFDPGHFFERKLKPYEWNPFGGGTRMCIGKGLAEVELKVVLATLCRRARLALAQQEVRPERHGFFFAPSEGLRVRRV